MIYHWGHRQRHGAGAQKEIGATGLELQRFHQISPTVMLDTHVSECLGDAISLLNATKFGISKAIPRMMNLVTNNLHTALVGEAGSTTSGRGCRLFLEMNLIAVLSISASIDCHIGYCRGS